MIQCTLVSKNWEISLWVGDTYCLRRTRLHRIPLKKVGFTKLPNAFTDKNSVYFNARNYDGLISVYYERIRLQITISLQIIATRSGDEMWLLARRAILPLRAY